MERSLFGAEEMCEDYFLRIREFSHTNKFCWDFNFFRFLFFKLWMRKYSERIFIVAKDMREDYFIRGRGFSCMQNKNFGFWCQVIKISLPRKYPDTIFCTRVLSQNQFSGKKNISK